ncbi:MAG: Hsp70 family protein [Clostridiales bacterium]|nr:Hsp70 family protein [Clostridiales bacterium]
MCKPGEKDPEAIPSVACIDDDGNLLTGYSAKAHIQLEDPEALSFSAFKMLLNEQDQRTLSSRNYSAEYTPKRVAGAFLQQQIHRILSNHAASEIENLVICAPEVWTTQNAVRHGQMDGRTILRDICGSIPEVKNVNVVSEPAAASAYFAYRYWETAPQSYRLLIIDYGGGTLDLTLTEMHSQGASVEIKVLYRTGFGENENGKIGNAGIAYMERVIRLAIAEATGATRMPFRRTPASERRSAPWKIS